jgi:hypothetical protein
MEAYLVKVSYAGSLIDIIELQANSEVAAKYHAAKRIEKLCGLKYAKKCKYEILES